MENEQTAEYAGFWMRFVALIIDSVVVQMLQYIIIIPILGIVGFGYLVPSMQDTDMIDTSNPEVLVAMVIGVLIPAYILATVLSILYFTLMESSKHQATLGKMAIGLKVTDSEGERLDFGKALIRQIGKIVSSFTFYIGYLMAGFTEKKQALHDYMAGTLVVKK